MELFTNFVLPSVAHTSTPTADLISSAAMFRYLVVVHLVACCIVILQHLTVGLKPTSRESKELNNMLFFSILVPFVQIPISLVRILYTYSEEFRLLDPLLAYLDFFWSPMLTIVLIWMTQVYVAKECLRVNRFVPPSQIYAPLRIYYLLATLLCGVLTSQIAFPIFIANGQPFDALIRIFALLALIAYTLELALGRYFKNGVLCLTSYTWIWFIGTWLYFIL